MLPLNTLIAPLGSLATLPSPDGWAGLHLLAQAGGGGFDPIQFLPVVALTIVAYLLFVVPQRAKDKKFQDLINGLKENDRVLTTGGLYGIVTNVQRDKGRLTLRIDESNGTKIKVAMWAIDSVVADD